MSRLSIRMSLVILSTIMVAAPAVAGAPASRTIMLFGARWCAPCMAEYKSLDELAAAAAPDHVAIAWVDRPIVPTGGSRLGIDVIPVPEARRLATRLVGDGYGLPFSAMLDAQGRACAVWRRPLRATDVAELRTRCDRGEIR